AQYLREFVNKVLAEYKLVLGTTKFAVTDNEAKMLAAFREQCCRIGCADHYLNKQLQHAFQSEKIHSNKSTFEAVGCELAQTVFGDIASNVLQNNNANRSQTSTIATTPKRKSLLTQCFDSKLTNQHQSSNSYQEIENYFNADYSNIPHNDDDLDDIDILSFWQENRHTFPQLAKLPKIICAIPASNIIVELLFFQQ
ncbi:unnamed protein product, partial [Rotaria socialis]